MKDIKSAKSSNQLHRNGHLSPFNFGKLVDPEASWDMLNLGKKETVTIHVGTYLNTRRSPDQLGDVLHWIRQIVAIVCGLIWGAIPLVGGIWIVIFLVLSSAIVYCYYAMMLKVDEEDFGGRGALLQEGLFASITLFLLTWTLVYSLGHF